MKKTMSQGQGLSLWKKSQANTFHGSTPSNFDPLGAPTLLLSGHNQALPFEYAGRAFPEKIEATMVLKARSITQETHLLLDLGEDEPNELNDVYGQTPAYDRVEWDPPTQVKIMQERVLYPLDQNFSLSMPHNAVIFEVLGEGEFPVELYQSYAYGGFLSRAALDSLYQSHVSLDHQMDGLKEALRGLTLGDRVNQGVMILDLLARNMALLSPEGLEMDFLASEPGEPVGQRYLSHHYTMLSDNTMRVTFFPED